jgi:hypothetical protein
VKYLQQLERVNSKLHQAAVVRPLYRDLERILDELETNCVDVLSENGMVFDVTHNKHLLDKANIIRCKTERQIKECVSFKESIEKNENPPDEEIPFLCQKKLRERRQLFVNEVNEVEHFNEQAQKALERIKSNPIVKKRLESAETPSLPVWKKKF